MISAGDSRLLRELHAAVQRARAILRARTELADVDVLLGCAHRAQRLGAHEIALSIVRGALLIDPDRAAAWALCGLLSERLGRSSDARAAYEAALARDEADLVTALALARLCARAGEYRRAEALAVFVLSRCEGQPEIQRAALLLKRRHGHANSRNAEKRG